MENISVYIANSDDFDEIFERISGIVHAFLPNHDMGRIGEVSQYVARAFEGDLSGYQDLQTLYHNRAHTLEVVLCTARMLHSLYLSGREFGPDIVDAALIGAYLHDIGYLKNDAEVGGTGAQFTATHVLRGVDFFGTHFPSFPAPLAETVRKVILSTDHRLPVSRLSFDSPQERLAALATANGDLIGQMANREYLERLALLFLEFREANMGGFKDLHDLLEKTQAFYRMTQTRLVTELDGLGALLDLHFEAATGVKRNYYFEVIQRNLDYLHKLLQASPGDRMSMLKRGNILDRIAHLL